MTSAAGNEAKRYAVRAMPLSHTDGFFVCIAAMYTVDATSVLDPRTIESERVSQHVQAARHTRDTSSFLILSLGGSNLFSSSILTPCVAKCLRGLEQRRLLDAI
jgi:hypothetical protein